MLEILELSRRATNRSGTSPREREKCAAVNKLKGVGDLKRQLRQNLEFVLQVCSLTLVQYFLTMFPFLPVEC